MKFLNKQKLQNNLGTQNSKIKSQNQNPKLNAVNFIHAITYRFIPINHFKIIGESMWPTLSDGKNVLVNRIAYLFNIPKVNDIVACRDPRDNKILIKRILKKENGKYFVLGDNKKASTDSRIFGMIEKKSIVGKVIYKF